MSQIAALPPCIGFGAYEARCDRPADTDARLWCSRCEALRREHLSGQFAEITKRAHDA